MRGKLVVWFGIALSAALLYYLVAHFDWGDVLEKLRLADLRWLLPAMVLYIALFPLRGLRWAILLRPVKPISLASATEVFLVGFTANNVMPARLGDVARAFVLGRKEGVDVSTSFSTVMLERVFDGLTVVAMLIAVLLIDAPNNAKIRAGGLLVGLVFLAAIVVCALVTWNQPRAVALASFFLKPFPEGIKAKAIGILERLADGLHTLRSPTATLEVIGLSVLIWGAEVAVYVVAQQAFAVHGMHVPVLGLVLTMAVLSLGLIVPSAPGFVGVYENLVIYSVGMYGIGAPLAPAFAVAMHVVHYVPGTLIGLGAGWRTGIRMRDFKNNAPDSDRDPPKGPEPKLRTEIAP
jgi:uncharacterized protein (TIRG00374 family)